MHEEDIQAATREKGTTAKRDGCQRAVERECVRARIPCSGARPSRTPAGTVHGSRNEITQLQSNEMNAHFVCGKRGGLVNTQAVQKKHLVGTPIQGRAGLPGASTGVDSQCMQHGGLAMPQHRGRPRKTYPCPVTAATPRRMT